MLPVVEMMGHGRWHRGLGAPGADTTEAGVILTDPGLTEPIPPELEEGARAIFNETVEDAKVIEAEESELAHAEAEDDDPVAVARLQAAVAEVERLGKAIIAEYDPAQAEQAKARRAAGQQKRLDDIQQQIIEKQAQLRIAKGLSGLSGDWQNPTIPYWDFADPDNPVVRKPGEAGDFSKNKDWVIRNFPGGAWMKTGSGLVWSDLAACPNKGSRLEWKKHQESAVSVQQYIAAGLVEEKIIAGRWDPGRVLGVANDALKLDVSPQARHLWRFEATGIHGQRTLVSLPRREAVPGLGRSYKGKYRYSPQLEAAQAAAQAKRISQEKANERGLAPYDPGLLSEWVIVSVTTPFTWKHHATHGDCRRRCVSVFRPAGPITPPRFQVFGGALPPSGEQSTSKGRPLSGGNESAPVTLQSKKNPEQGLLTDSNADYLEPLSKDETCFGRIPIWERATYTDGAAVYKLVRLVGFRCYQAEGQRAEVVQFLEKGGWKSPIAGWSCYVHRRSKTAQFTKGISKVFKNPYVAGALIILTYGAMAPALLAVPIAGPALVFAVPGKVVYDLARGKGEDLSRDFTRMVAAGLFVPGIGPVAAMFFPKYVNRVLQKLTAEAFFTIPGYASLVAHAETNKKKRKELREKFGKRINKLFEKYHLGTVIDILVIVAQVIGTILLIPPFTLIGLAIIAISAIVQISVAALKLEGAILAMRSIEEDFAQALTDEQAIYDEQYETFLKEMRDLDAEIAALRSQGVSVPTQTETRQLVKGRKSESMVAAGLMAAAAALIIVKKQGGS
jgi:hypothetical protein